MEILESQQSALISQLPFEISAYFSAIVQCCRNPEYIIWTNFQALVKSQSCHGTDTLSLQQKITNTRKLLHRKAVTLSFSRKKKKKLV